MLGCKGISGPGVSLNCSLKFSTKPLLCALIVGQCGVRWRTLVPDISLPSRSTHQQYPDEFKHCTRLKLPSASHLGAKTPSMMRSFALAFDSASCLSRRHLVVVVTTRLWERCGTDGLVPAMKLQFKLQCMLTWERIYFIQTISELKVSYVVHETLNPLSPKVSLVILFTVCLQFSLYQFGEFGNRSISNLMIDTFFHSHHLYIV